jgi:hypothetical protein
MTTLNTEEKEMAQAIGAEKPKLGKKARAAAKPAHVGPKKAKTAPRSKAAKKAGSAREGSKAAKIIDLLRRPNGATLAEIVKGTNWQAHSIRGFISAAAKKRALKIESTKNQAGGRIYKAAT